MREFGPGKSDRDSGIRKREVLSRSPLTKTFLNTDLLPDDCLSWTQSWLFEYKNLVTDDILYIAGDGWENGTEEYPLSILTKNKEIISSKVGNRIGDVLIKSIFLIGYETGNDAPKFVDDTVNVLVKYGLLNPEIQIPEKYTEMCREILDAGRYFRNILASKTYPIEETLMPAAFGEFIEGLNF